NLAHTVATNITILFSSGTLSNVTSSTIVVSPAAGHHLAMQAQPSASAIAGVAFTNQPVVRIEDAFGNLVSADNSTVVRAARNLGAGSLQGTTNATVSAGVASFANLSYNVAETINITFSSGSLSNVTSSSILVNPAGANRL